MKRKKDKNENKKKKRNSDPVLPKTRSRIDAATEVDRHGSVDSTDWLGSVSVCAGSVRQQIAVA